MTIEPNTKSMFMVPLVRMELLSIGRRRMSAEELQPRPRPSQGARRQEEDQNPVIGFF
jgi:hypothetical protein